MQRSKFCNDVSAYPTRYKYTSDLDWEGTLRLGVSQALRCSEQGFPLSELAARRAETEGGTPPVPNPQLFLDHDVGYRLGNSIYKTVVISTWSVSPDVVLSWNGGKVL